MGSAGTESVQSEGVFIVFTLVVVVLSAGVELAENQLPVIALFFFVVVDRDPAAEVLDLNGLSRKRVTMILFPKPSLASSIELERISNIECSQPSRPSDPKMTEGRFRTRSAPFKEEML